MTATITIKWAQPGTNEPLVAQDGAVQVTPMQGWIAGDTIVNPRSRSYTISGGTTTIEIDDSAERVWKFVNKPTGMAGWTEYKLVPAEAGEVLYTELTSVDEKSAKPTAPVLANAMEEVAKHGITSGTVIGDTLVLTRGDGSSINAGNVRGPAGEVDLNQLDDRYVQPAALSDLATKDEIPDVTPLATKSELEPLAAKTEIAPTVASEIDDPDSEVRARLNAATVQSLTTPTDIARAVERPNVETIQALKARVAAVENKAKNNPVRVVRLNNGTEGPTPTAFSGMSVSASEVEGRSAWKVETTTGPARCDVTLPSQLDAGPVSAVSLWVYITDPAAVASVQISIYGDGTTWTRNLTQTGSNFENLTDKSLKRGWNLVRFTPTSSTAWRTLQTPSRFNLTFLKPAGWEGPTVNYVHTVDLEVREKATALIVADWGSKPFYDNAYPDMLARGWPVIWAPRTERFGEGPYPDNMTTLAEVKALMADGNGNEVSFHSPRGSATSGLSPEQQRAEVLDALVGLKVHGVYTDGALWRAAWVQNVAPNSWAADDLLVAAATPNDRYHSGPWPALDRHDIPRSGMIRGYGTSNTLNTLLDTHGFDVFYTHGVIPDAEHSPGNHAKQSEWDALVADMDAAVAAGRLEVLNFGQVLDRYPLTRHLDERVILVDAPTYTPPTP